MRRDDRPDDTRMKTRGGNDGNSRPKADDLAIDGIFELIQRREIFPGSRIFETELEEKLSMSRTPIRQAFNQLAADGVLEKRPQQKGFFFPKLTIEDLCHAYIYREQLETTSVRLASVGLTPEAEERLHSVIQHEEQLCELRVIETYREIHKTFHVTMASVGGNPYIERSVRHIYLRFAFYEFYYGSYRLQKDQQRAKEIEADQVREHEAIFEAVRQKEPERAADLMRRHLRSSPISMEHVQGEQLWHQQERALRDSR